MHAVTAVVWARAELPLHIVQQPQPVTHIGQRNAVAEGVSESGLFCVQSCILAGAH